MNPRPAILLRVDPGLSWDGLLSGLVGGLIGSAVAVVIAVVGWARENKRYVSDLRKHDEEWHRDQRRNEWRQMLDAVGDVLNCETKCIRGLDAKIRAEEVNRSDKHILAVAADSARADLICAAENAMRVAGDRVFLPATAARDIGRVAADLWVALLDHKDYRVVFDLCASLRTESISAARSDLGNDIPEISERQQGSGERSA